MNPAFFVNLEVETLDNRFYRRVMYTSPVMQLVLMSLRPGEQIPSEVHPLTDQFVRVEKGTGVTIIDRTVHNLEDGTGIIIPAGHEHQFVNTGDNDLRMYVIYSSPEHSSQAIEVIDENTGQLIAIRK